MHETINVIGDDWEKITFIGDSGAVEHVINSETAKSSELKQTWASRNGLTYRAANGTPIQNYGERRLRGTTDNNHGFKMVCQVTDCRKNLASLVKIVREGNDMVLSTKGSYIKNVKSGVVMPMNIESGIPQFDVWVKGEQDKQKDRRTNTGQYGVLNENGEADIPDSQVSAFTRLEMSI